LVGFTGKGEVTKILETQFIYNKNNIEDLSHAFTPTLSNCKNKYYFKLLSMVAQQGFPK